MTQDQAVGMYLGMVIGDYLGAPWEFCPPLKDINDVYPREGGVHNVSVGEWTDDTAMARCITDSYIRYNKLVPYHVLRNFGKWYKDGKFGTRDYCFDIGNRTRRALDFARQNSTIDIDEFAFHQKDNGNGSIMRLAPVVFARRDDLAMCIGDAVLQSLITHPAPKVLGIVSMLAEELWLGECSTPNLLSKRAYAPRNLGEVSATRESAWYSVLMTDNFEDAVKDAVSRGDDADTVGAVAGMIAGRLYGASAIPARLIDPIMHLDQINAEIDELWECTASS